MGSPFFLRTHLADFEFFEMDNSYYNFHENFSTFLRSLGTNAGSLGTYRMTSQGHRVQRALGTRVNFDGVTGYRLSLVSLLFSTFFHMFENVPKFNISSFFLV